MAKFLIRKPAAVAPTPPTGDPDLPQASVDVSLPTGWDGTADYTPSNAAQLATALTDAASDSGLVIIELTAGTNYDDNFVLDNDGKGDTDWTIIRSSAYASLPAVGTRAAPADASNMPKIRSDNNGAQCIQMAYSSHHYRFIGIEITSTVATAQQLVITGFEGGSSASVPADLSEYVVFDRCYIHGDSGTLVEQGMVISADNFALVDCFVDDIMAAGNNTIGVQSYQGGPHLVQNSRITGAGHNYFVGDDYAAGSQPHDVTITGNHIYKPPAWEGTYGVKNSVEIKNGIRCLFEGNVVENCWADAQAGFMVLHTPRGGTVNNITWKYNVLKNSYRGLQASSTDHVQSDILFVDNLFMDIDHRIFALERSAAGALIDFAIRHNTVVSAGTNNNVVVYYGESDPAITGFDVIDNLFHGRADGSFLGDGQSDGYGSTNFYTTSFDIDNNGFINQSTLTENTNFANFIYAANIAASGFTDATLDDVADFAIISGPFNNTASDGADCGADIATLLTKIND